MDWSSTINWSFGFVNKSKELLDDTTIGVLNLAFDVINNKKNLNPDENAKVKKEATAKKKKIVKKGPKMRNIEL